MSNIACPQCGTPVEGLELCPKCKTNIKKILEMQKRLKTAYENAVAVPEVPKSDMVMGMLPPKLASSAIRLANHYHKKHPNSTEKQIASLIRWQIAKSAALGFTTGILGFFTGILGFIIGLLGSSTGLFKSIICLLGKIINIDIQNFLDIQTRMVVAIAYIKGHDLESDDVEARVETCMAGDRVTKVLKKIGAEIGVAIEYVIENLPSKITPQIAAKISWFVACELTEKSIKRALASFSKMVPIIGALAGAIIDAVCAKRIANAAEKCFATED